MRYSYVTLYHILLAAAKKTWLFAAKGLFSKSNTAFSTIEGFFFSQKRKSAPHNLERLLYGSILVTEVEAILRGVQSECWVGSYCECADV